MPLCVGVKPMTMNTEGTADDDDGKDYFRAAFC